MIRWVASATLVMAAALGIGRFAYTPLLPDMTRLYEWQFAQAGDVASANYFGYFLGALLAPLAAHSRWLRLWIALSLMLSAATTALGAYADNYLAWILLRGVAGAASAYCLVLVTTQLGLVLSAQRADAWGNIHFAGVGLGILICMACLSGAAAVDQQWARLGMISAIMMLAAWWLVAPLDDLHVAESGRPQTASYRMNWQRVWPLVVGYGLFGYGYVIAATFVVAMAEQVATPAWPATTVWWVVGAALVPSVYIWQWLANRWQLYLALRVAYLVEAVGMLWAAYAQSMFSLVISCILLGGTFAAITALGLSAARMLSPQHTAAVIAWMTLSFALGQWVGPAVGGRLADSFDGFVVPSLSAVFALVVAAGLVRWPKQMTTQTVSRDVR